MSNEGCMLNVLPSDLDDNEFDIPKVDQVPSLESILTSGDDDLVSTDNNSEPHGFGIFAPGHAHLLSSSEVSETSSLSIKDADGTKERGSRSVQYSEHGPVLRHVTLKSISAQVASAADRIDAGSPSCLVISSLVAVGTNHGVVLVFDPQQVLVWCLGGAAGIGAEFGAVTALSLNNDCTRLLAGYARGHIIMWDLTTGKVLRTVANVHTPGASILHVKFTSDRNIALSNDSGGSLFALEFRRLIGVRSYDAQCVFSGSRGQICCVEPLITDQHASHPANVSLLFAVASLSKVVIASLRPELRIHCVHKLTGSPATFPLLTWQFYPLRISDLQAVIDPVLAFARDSSVSYAHVSYRNDDDVSVKILREMVLPYKLLSIAWFNARTVLCLDTNELAHVTDIKTGEEVEVMDLSDIDLVYSTPFYKSPASEGTKASQLSARTGGQCPCYQSVVSFRGQLFILGSASVEVLNLRTWLERLAVLTKHRRFPAALALAQTFLDGSAKTVIGLTGDSQKRRETVIEQIVEVLLSFVDFALSERRETCLVDVDRNSLQVVITHCIDFCIRIDKTDLLFDFLYGRFSTDETTRSMFLESLESYMLDGSLENIPPAVMKDFVDHYEQCGALTAVEACITRIDIASLDIHQVISLCWTWNLYDAILYVYNRGMSDYVTPLQQLLAVLKTAVDASGPLNQAQLQLGNKILVYLSCCLSGRAYPLGDIPTELVTKVCSDVLDCITIPIIGTQASNRGGRLAYPHMWTLLQFNARELFNVLSLSFEDGHITLTAKQHVIDVLLQLIIENYGFSSQQISSLFTFLARQMARENNALSINTSLFERVLVSLCVEQPKLVDGLEESSGHEERQQALLELLATSALNGFDETRLMHLADTAGFYRVVELLCRRRREFDRVLMCYCLDSARRHMSFDYLQQIICDGTVTSEEKSRLRVATLENVEKLIEIDAPRAMKAVVMTLGITVHEVFQRFDRHGGDERLLFQFLHRAFELYGDFLESPEDVPELDTEICERYIELLCKLSNSEDVLRFLKTSNGYRVEVAMSMCRRLGVTDAVIFLLEKSGKVNSAFEVAFQRLQSTLTNLVLLNSHRQSKMAANLEIHLGNIISLLCRHSPNLELSVRESVWFSLVDILVESLEQCIAKLSNDASVSISRTSDAASDQPLQVWIPAMIQRVVTSMILHVPFDRVVERVWLIARRDADSCSRCFGNVRDLLIDMIDCCRYEQETVAACSRVVARDVHDSIALLTATTSRGVAPSSNLCSTCCRPLGSDMERGDSDEVVCFRCGHSFHNHCLHQSFANRDVGEPGTPTPRWRCPVCTNPRTTWRSRVVSTRVIASDALSSTASETCSLSGGKSASGIDFEVGLSAAMQLFRVHRTSSRLIMLTQLKQQLLVESQGGYKAMPSAGTLNLLENERFSLKLSPPSPATT